VGIVGFICIVVPHMVRKTIGSDERFLFAGSAIAGPILLLASDTAARLAFSPVVLPVGIVTSFLGAPLFLYLVLKRRSFR
jgi:iron complex transport system permease protein